MTLRLVFTLSSIGCPRLDSRNAHAWGVQIIGHLGHMQGSGAVEVAGVTGLIVDDPAAMVSVLGNMSSRVPVGAGG